MRRSPSIQRALALGLALPLAMMSGCDDPDAGDREPAADARLAGDPIPAGEPLADDAPLPSGYPLRAENPLPTGYPLPAADPLAATAPPRQSEPARNGYPPRADVTDPAPRLAGYPPRSDGPVPSDAAPTASEPAAAPPTADGRPTTADPTAPRLFEVTAVVRSAPRSEPAASEPPPLELRRARFFSYALPAGWSVGEDGQHALTLIAPDQRALTMLVGNAGLLPGHAPAQFVQDTLAAIRPEGLRLTGGRPCKPLAGFQQAFEFDVRYAIGGQPCAGVARCHVAPYYGGATMAVTAALADASQWAGYRDWLPLVAEQIAAHDGAAFGMRGAMQQNLAESQAYAEAARRYREWSARTQAETTAHRHGIQDRQQREVRENLGAVGTWHNPFEPERPLEIGTRYQHYWIDRDGRVLGSDDPGADPNVGSTVEWRRLERR